MLYKDLTTKTESELRQLGAEKRVEYQAFFAGLGSGKTKNVRAGREIKKTIARIETKLSALNLNK